MERRTVLKAAVGAPILLWVTPVVKTFAPSPAFAANRHSAAPKPPRNPGRVESSQLPTPTPAPAAVATGQLPFTGDSELREAAVGAAAFVAGAVVVANTREPRAL